MGHVHTMHILHIAHCTQSMLAPPPVVQPPPAESATEPELVGDHDGTGLAVGIVR